MDSTKKALKELTVEQLVRLLEHRYRQTEAIKTLIREKMKKDRVRI